MKMILVTIGQSMFYLFFPKYLRKSCIKDLSFIYQSTIYFVKNSLIFKQGLSTEHAIMQVIDQGNDKLKTIVLLSAFLLIFLKHLTL